jgi:hypothetical protein
MLGLAKEPIHSSPYYPFQFSYPRLVARNQSNANAFFPSNAHQAMGRL